MKGKKILALASIFAGAALIGSTFAAWAVTDNADPFGVKVSPGTIASDTINYVTLSYGERTYSNVEGLAIGTNRLAATVGLIADTSNSQSYTGKFAVNLIDQTATKGEGAKYLIDYLTVNVYTDTIAADTNGVVTTDVSKLTPIATLNKTTAAATPSVTVSDNTAKPVYVTVSLSNSVTASILEEIRSDVVYIQMNWNSSGTDEVSASKVYFNYGTAGKKAYLYAWTASKVNGQYPGVLMTDDGNGLYSLDLSLEYSDLLFVVKNGDNEEYKSADQQLTSTMRTQTPCFNRSGANWTAKSETLDPGYYLVGSINAWTPSAQYKLTQDSTETNVYRIENIQLAAGDKIKVRDNTGEHWYGTTAPSELEPQGGVWTDCGFTTDSDGNIIISEAGVYTINCNTTDAQGHHIYLDK